MSLKEISTQISNGIHRFVLLAQKAWIALEASGCTYEMEKIPLYGVGGKPKWFLKLNPAGTVPVLTHKDHVVPDSELILDYIANGSIGGASKLVRKNKNSDLSDKWRDIIKQRVVPIGKKAVLGGGRCELMELLKEIDNEVVGPFLCGDSVSVADCAAFPFLWRINDEFGLDSCPKLSKWLNMCSEMDAFKKTIQTSWWWWW